MADARPLDEALLEQLAARWAAVNARARDRVEPGLSDAEMDAITAPLGLRVPGEARVLWRWHNGAGRMGFVNGMGKCFASLELCVENTQMMQGIAQEAVKGYGYGPAESAESAEAARKVWDPRWLTLAVDGFGCALVVEAAAVGRDRPLSPVTYHDRNGQTRVATSSIAELVRQWIRAFDVGLVTYDPSTDAPAFEASKVPDDFDESLI